MMLTAALQVADSGMAAGVLPHLGPPAPEVAGDIMADRPYSRVYYVDLARDYPDIWQDVRALGTYVHLLTIAEAMWPATPEVPRSAQAGIVKRLESAGLLIALPRYCYRIKGLDAERTARSNAGRYAAGIRHGLPTAMPKRNEPNQAESKAGARRNGLENLGDAMRRMMTPAEVEDERRKLAKP